MTRVSPGKGETGCSDKGLRIAIVASRFNDYITNRLLAGAVEALKLHEVDEASVPVFWIPGAFEAPLAAKRAAQTGRFDAVITLGAVIRGQTAHFDLVAGQAASGVMQAGLETGVPIIFGVLATENLEQAEERSESNRENKGFEAAEAAIDMAHLLREID